MGEQSEWELWLSFGRGAERRGGVNRRRDTGRRPGREPWPCDEAIGAAAHAVLLARSTRAWPRGMPIPRLVLRGLWEMHGWTTAFVAQRFHLEDMRLPAARALRKQLYCAVRTATGGRERECNRQGQQKRARARVVPARMKKRRVLGPRNVKCPVISEELWSWFVQRLRTCPGRIGTQLLVDQGNIWPVTCTMIGWCGGRKDTPTLRARLSCPALTRIGLSGGAKPMG